MRRHARTWRQGNILCSSLWSITFRLDGLVTKGSFHKTKVHTRTSGKVSMLTRTLRMNGSRPVTGELGPPVLRSNKDPSYSSRKQFMEYSTLHSSHDVPYQERGHCAAWPVCSNIEQCVYVSDINSTENLVEMVEGVSFTFQL